MSKRVLALLGIFGACALFSGCGKESDGVAENDLASGLAQQLCDSLGSCCAVANVTFDAADCKATVTAQFNAQVAQLHTPNIVYDAEAAGDCLSEYPNALTCGRPNGTTPEACARVYQGKLAEGATCQRSQECARPAGGIASCGSTDSGGAKTCRLLRSGSPVHGKAGEACSGDCEANSCSTIVDSSGGPSAGSTTVCYRSDGLHCGSTRTCETLAVVGAPCTSRDDCVDDAFCDFSAGKCSPDREVGEACTDSRDCKSGACDEAGAVCLAGGVTAERCGRDYIDD